MELDRPLAVGRPRFCGGVHAQFVCEANDAELVQ